MEMIDDGGASGDRQKITGLVTCVAIDAQVHIDMGRHFFSAAGDRTGGAGLDAGSAGHTIVLFHKVYVETGTHGRIAYLIDNMPLVYFAEILEPGQYRINGGFA